MCTMIGASTPITGSAKGQAGWFRVTVTDDKGRRAWSNPIWIGGQTLRV